MVSKDFSLDFSGLSGVPSQWGINVDQVVKLFHQQTSGLQGTQIIADRKRGVFNVTTLTKEAAATLSSFKLVIEKGGKRREIPLKERRRRLKPAVWASINRTCDDEMRDVPNSYFDQLLASLGAIVVEPTKRRKYRGSNVLNGQREVLIEVGEKHIDRQQRWTGETEGESHDWFITYRGQPFQCRNCDDWHQDGNCPKWTNKKGRGTEKKDEKHKYLFFSTSVLRRAVDSKTTRFDCIPGARIGHVANHVNNDATILPTLKW